MDTENVRNEKPPVSEDQTVYTDRGPLSLPLDLTQWFTPDQLLGWIQQVIGSLDPNKPEVREFARMLPEIRPEVTLKLLLYSYSTKVFASEDIATACREDTVQNKICGGKAPFPQELSQFRRKHRVLVQDLLAQVLLSAVRERYGFEKLPPGLEYAVILRALDRIDAARLMDEKDE